jgi:hypothetical protein
MKVRGRMGERENRRNIIKESTVNCILGSSDYRIAVY